MDLFQNSLSKSYPQALVELAIRKKKLWWNNKAEESLWGSGVQDPFNNPYW